MTPMLELRNVTKRFADHRLRSNITAVDNVSIEIPAGTRMGLVGESGSGKTTLARCALRLSNADAGEITFDGTRLDHISGNELRRIRTQFQYVFQNPYLAFNPRTTIRQSIAEPMLVHGICNRGNAEKRVTKLLERVELSADLGGRYPHELSGGELQRASIARALSVKPRLLVLDEPLSALDVSLRSQMLTLFDRLRQELSLTYLLISHDLGVVAHHTDTVAVMHSARIVEFGQTELVLSKPAHPYTRDLLLSVPSVDPKHHKTLTSTGQITGHSENTEGCRYFARCGHSMKDEQCERKQPQLKGTAMASVACHHVVPDRESKG